MKRSVAALAIGTLLLLTSGSQLPGTPPSELRDLFNGKDLTGWVNVNTDPDTWSLRDGLLVCKGKPIGVMRLRESARRTQHVH